jgi:hypothetical protein
MEATQEQIEYIKHLRSLGIEPLDAIRMAQQARSLVPRHLNAYEALVRFAMWDDTVEGPCYWADRARKALTGQSLEQGVAKIAA